MGVYIKGIADEDTLRKIKESGTSKIVYFGVRIDNVTLLPEHHGDLVEVDEVSYEVWDQICCDCNKYDGGKGCVTCDISKVKRILGKFPVVIPKDGGE